MESRRIARLTGAVMLIAGAIAAIGALVVRDQISRSRRDLFSPHALRRLAALGYIGGTDASVEMVRVLRDYVSWEQRPLLRKRAAAVLGRMEAELREQAVGAGGVTG